MHIIGDVTDRVAVVVDDMIDTAGTLTKGAAVVKAHGAKEVYALATHPVFSGPAYERIEESVLSKVIVTNTIPLKEGVKTDKIQVVSLGSLLGDAIERVHGDQSITSLFTQ
jgi:ribose-phosphate pyrophosphokinase